MKVELTVERIKTNDRPGVRVAVTGDNIEPFTIATQFVAPPDIGKYLVDRVLDTVYLRRYTVCINGVVAFESFDAERDYEDFIRQIDAVPESGK
jgi:hypothetical protein